MENQNQNQNKMNSAVAAVAWRNNGEKAPITVRFTQVKENLSADFHSRMILRGIGIKNITSQGLLVNYTEDMFNEDFAKFGFTADSIVNGYRNENGEIVAHKLEVSAEDIFGYPVYISRYETTNTLEATNDSGELKSGWSIKSVNGQQLTNHGALIYSTFIFSEDGVDQKLQHDQNLSKSASIENIEESSTSKAKSKVASQVEDSLL
jgi:hypothetical protein